MKSEIVARRLDELDCFLGRLIKKGDFLYVSDNRRKALLENPYLSNSKSICEWVGYADDKPAGFNYSFPIQVWADGQIYHATTGSSLNVSEWARKTDLGLILPAKGVEQTSKDGIAIAAACSQMAIPLHKINGYKYFFFPRYIALWKCRSVAERYLPKLIVKPIITVGDCILSIMAFCLRHIASFVLRGYSIVKVSPNDNIALDTISNIVASDSHCFRENHDAAWFKWHMTNTFSDNEPCETFILKKNGSDEIVAFALIKRRFHEQASQRGFKDVWLASIVEWGAFHSGESLIKWFIALLAGRSAKDCDDFELATDDKNLGRFVKCLGWRQVGDANVGVKVMKKFPLYANKDIIEQSNWRIRPGMGDNALS